MSNRKKERMQVTDIIGLYAIDAANIIRKSVLFSEPIVSDTCRVCGAKFDKRAASRVTVCGADCKRERVRLANAKYVEKGRELRERLISEFGETRPTEDDFIRIVRLRKGRK